MLPDLNPTGFQTDPVQLRADRGARAQSDDRYSGCWSCSGIRSHINHRIFASGDHPNRASTNQVSQSTVLRAPAGCRGPPPARRLACLRHPQACDDAACRCYMPCDVVRQPPPPGPHGSATRPPSPHRPPEAMRRGLHTQLCEYRGTSASRPSLPGAASLAQCVLTVQARTHSWCPIIAAQRIMARTRTLFALAAVVCAVAYIGGAAAQAPIMSACMVRAVARTAAHVPGQGPSRLVAAPFGSSGLQLLGSTTCPWIAVSLPQLMVHPLREPQAWHQAHPCAKGHKTLPVNVHEVTASSLNPTSSGAGGQLRRVSRQRHQLPAV